MCICVALTMSTLDASGATKYNRTHYNQWCCVTDYTACDAARQIPASKLMHRSIYDILTQSSNDWQRSLCRVQCRQTLGPRLKHASPKNAWKTPAAPLSPSFQSARACAFVASAIAKQQWPALSLTTRKFQLRIMDFQHWKSLAVALLLNLFQNGYLCTAVTSGVDAWVSVCEKKNDRSV